MVTTTILLVVEHHHTYSIRIIVHSQALISMSTFICHCVTLLTQLLQTAILEAWQSSLQTVESKLSQLYDQSPQQGIKDIK